MSDLSKEEKAKEKKKILTGLGLTAVIFAWFLYYLLSHIPG
ncbi:hypothetical protein MMIC_P0325 [Mariprofundus micogutta]|uniref:Uncharacterized protein n=1 Tax=Mariprofundus micogutta TaxID=1921010 RepID=A0A1L8CKG2_9PROT|nr:hypothetical protein [Mariprofundus micogutta]GAV19391.1 hypothetical protein MMIC_P0325 [Mariprofundus micogutta]